MIWYCILNSADSILTFCLAIFVLMQGKQREMARALAALLISVSIWSIGVGVHSITHDKTSALYWSWLLHYGAVPLPILYLNFTEVLLDKKRPILLITLSLIDIILLILIPTKSFIKEVSPILNFYAFPKAGPLYPIFIILFATCMFICFYDYATSLRSLHGINRNKVKYVFFGSAISVIFGSTAFLPEFNIPFFPYGTPIVVLNAAFITYSILAYRLVDITVIIRKTLVYSAVMAILTAIYLAIVLLFTKIFEGLTGYQTIFSSAIAALLITVFFQPLRKRIQAFVDGKFFRQYVDREEKLYELSREVITHTTPEAMAQSLIRVLSDTLHPKSAALYLRSRDGNGFTLVSEQNNVNIPDRMLENNPLNNYFIDHPQPFVQQDLPTEMGEPLNTRRPPRKEESA